MSNGISACADKPLSPLVPCLPSVIACLGQGSVLSTQGNYSRLVANPRANPCVHRALRVFYTCDREGGLVLRLQFGLFVLKFSGELYLCSGSSQA